MATGHLLGLYHILCFSHCASDCSRVHDRSHQLLEEGVVQRPQRVLRILRVIVQLVCRKSGWIGASTSGADLYAFGAVLERFILWHVLFALRTARTSRCLTRRVCLSVCSYLDDTVRHHVYAPIQWQFGHQR
jgi:hypothetical protein